MNEEENKQEPAENSGEGDKPKTASKIEQAREERKEFERATAERKAENDRSEALAEERALGGESEGGSQSVAKKEETPKEYNDRIDKEMSEGKHAD